MASVATAPEIKVARCKRCATILRKARTVCPCCNLDVNAPPEEPAPSASGSRAAAGAAAASGSGASDGGSQKKVRPAAAKSGVKICPICMATVKEEEMQDVQGKRVCQGCSERMQKTGGGAAAAPAPAQDQSSSGNSGGGKLSIEAAATSTMEYKSYAHEEERLKKRLYRAKWILVIFSAVFMLMGVMAVIGGGAVSNTMETLNPDEIEAKLERDPNFKKLSASEKEERRQNFEKGKAIVGDLAWRAKLVGYLLIGVGLFFAVVFFLMNSYPFEASLIAMIVYVLFKAWQLSAEGLPNLFNIVIIVAVAGALIDAVTAGTEINKLRAEKAANSRKPARG